MGRPFLRWAGGKQRVVTSLLPFVPASGEYRSYFEPFLGGGSLFFAVQPHAAVLSDVNAELMICYQQVAKNHIEVADLLEWYRQQDSREFFYRVRKMDHSKMLLSERAARFIYLNKAAFNGIFRVNRMGQFNAPYGPSIRGPAIPSTQTLAAAAYALNRATLVTGDFEQALEGASDGDFVYLDPPYPPRSRTAFFTHYSADRFGWDQQMRVARVFEELADRGCRVMLSNIDQCEVIQLYRKFQISRLSVVRWLGSNGDRFRVREIIVTNYVQPDGARE